MYVWVSSCYRGGGVIGLDWDIGYFMGYGMVREGISGRELYERVMDGLVIFLGMYVCMVV